MKPKRILISWLLLVLGASMLQKLYAPCWYTKFNETCPELHPLGWLPVGMLFAASVVAFGRTHPSFRDSPARQLAAVVAGVFASLAIGGVFGFPPVSHGFTSWSSGPSSPPVTTAFWILSIVPFIRQQWVAYGMLGAAMTLAFQDVLAL